MDLNNPVFEMAVTIAASVLASSGFWAFLQRHLDKNDASKRLLVGLAHDRITFLGMKYIERGWLTADEYENLRVYLYEPYREGGGNGTAEKVMHEVDAKCRILKMPPPEYLEARQQQYKSCPVDTSSTN